MKKFITLLALAYIPCIAFSQTTITIKPPTDDTWVYFANQNMNDCSNSLMGAGVDGNGDELIPFIKFDLSQIPSCAVITNADLRINQLNTLSGSVCVDIRKVDGAWDECTLTWANMPSTSAPYGTPYCFSGSANQLHDISVTTLVQDLLQFSNNGLALDYNSGNETVDLETKEGNPEPELIVTYTLDTSLAPSSINPQQNPICSGDTIQLTRQGGSLGIGGQYEWYSGSCGGTYIGSGVNIAVSPTSTIDYYVRIEGCDTSGCAFIQIVVNQPPTADFTASSTIINETDCISFTDQSTNSPTSWSWTFTEGFPTSSTSQNPTNICYNTAGIHQVSLTATNSCGSDTKTTASYITVTPVQIPEAEFTASSTSICESDCINFTDQTLNSPTSWNWTFTGGSPSSSTSQNPTSICYSTAGTYQVSLTATNSDGSDTEIKTAHITVNTCLGVEDLSFINSLSIYPNPNTGNFMIEMDITKVANFQIKLLNVIGQTVYEEKVNSRSGIYQKEINLSGHGEGIYFLSIETKEGVIRKKVLIVQ